MDLEQKYLDAIERNRDEVEMKSISNLKEFIRYYLQKYQGSKKCLDVETVTYITEILQGSKADYLIFDNTENQLFTIWKGTDKVTKMIEENEMINVGYAYAYRLRGLDHIINPFIRGEMISYSS
jgi:hypothetical protein